MTPDTRDGIRIGVWCGGAVIFGLLLGAQLYAYTSRHDEFVIPPASVATPTVPARYEACAADDSSVCMCCCVSTEGTHPTPIAYYHGEKWLPDDLLKPRWPWLYQYKGGAGVNTQPNSTVACHSEGDHINVCYGPIQ